MKRFNKQILEAINRGINLALDDYEDDNLLSSKSNVIKNIDTKELWKIHNMFVNLGLPSGTLWAKYNLGVDIDKIEKTYLEKLKVADKFKELYGTDPKAFLELNKRPEDWYGNYYAWGELTPKTEYTLDNYKFGLTKYNEEDLLTELLLEDDTACQYDHRMKIPTKELFEELLKYTNNEWIKNYLGIKGLNGRLFTSKINGELLFIPASGYMYQDLFNGDGSYCNLWSSNLYTDNPSRTWNLYFYSNDINLNGYYRDCGFTIRPVLNRN